MTVNENYALPNVGLVTWEWLRLEVLERAARPVNR
jgi:hypothetical protein